MTPGRPSPRALWLGGLALACLAVYGRALSYGFVSYDDNIYVFDNRVVVSGLSWATVKWAFDGQHIGHFHPLTWLSHLLDVSLFGLDARGHHATNVALHAGCTLLLFHFLCGATGSMGRAGVAALLFAVHPLHVEPVVWVSSRKDLLSTLFLLVALVLYRSYVRSPGVLRYAAVALAYVAGLLAKPMVITLPALLLVLDFWPFARIEEPSGGRPHGARLGPRAARLVGEKLPLFAIAALSSRMTIASATDAGVMEAQNLSLWARVQNSLVSYVSYLRELVLPVDLSIQHDRLWSAPPAWQTGGALVLLGAAAALALILRRARPYVLAGLLFFLISFLPVIGLWQYGGHSTADRYAYVPSIGFFVLVVWAVADLLATVRAGLRSAVTAAVLSVCALLAFLQIGYWRSSEVLFLHALEIEPDSPRAHNLLGVELANRGELDRAAEHYARAIALFPTYTKPMNNLGVLLFRQGRAVEAIDVYRRLIEVAPDDPKAHSNLALALLRSGAAVEAEQHLRAAIRADPDYLTPRFELARLLAASGRRDEARAVLRAAIAIFPSRPELRAALDALDLGY